MAVCTRCNNERQSLVLMLAPVAGRTLSSAGQFDELPLTERTCFECLTDSELAHELHRVVAFVLQHLSGSVDESSPMHPGLEVVLAFFTARQNAGDDYRADALRALSGLISKSEG